MPGRWQLSQPQETVDIVSRGLTPTWLQDKSVSAWFLVLGGGFGLSLSRPGVCQSCRHANKELSREVTTAVRGDGTERIIAVGNGSSHAFFSLFLMNGIEKNSVNHLSLWKTFFINRLSLHTNGGAAFLCILFRFYVLTHSERSPIQYTHFSVFYFDVSALKDI